MRHLLPIALLVFSLAGGTAGAQQERPSELVRSWYQQYLGREPDPGAQGWVNQLRGGTSPADVLASILGSDEFYRKAGSTPEGYIRALFQDVAGRAPTEAELRYWARQLWRIGRRAVALALLNQQPPAIPAGETPPVMPPP